MSSTQANGLSKRFASGSEDFLFTRINTGVNSTPVFRYLRQHPNLSGCIRTAISKPTTALAVYTKN
ncbi:MAG: hypothetical protein J7L86_00020 [Candidatus Marinimicrobia bacterium]|nr:hypothetical protein [Candidatus Neomarinimicrobiota bacterium]